MKEICLYNLEQAGLIVLEPNGIPYFNQTGGKASLLSKATGYFVPISNDPPLDQPGMLLTERLTSITKNCSSISNAEAKLINELLFEVSSTDRYSVDVEKLEQSHESWIYVKVCPSGDYSQFNGFDEFCAVLTWPNSY